MPAHLLPAGPRLNVWTPLDNNNNLKRKVKTFSEERKIIIMSNFITLSNGREMPTIGLGTWLSPVGEVGGAVEMALKIGYRHFDFAQGYMNQKEIGPVLERALNGKTIKREDLFITSKIWNTFHSFDLCKKALDDILTDLKLHYLDLCLIHWPHGFEENGPFFPKNEDGTMRYSDVDFMETWRGLEQCLEENRVKAIGLSNFNSMQVQRVIREGRIKPAVLQIELHPYFQQRKLVDFCQSKGLAITAYSPLGSLGNPFRNPDQDPDILQDVVIVDIAKCHGKSPAQVILRWAIQRGLAVIPKSVSEKRIRENFDVYSFALTDEQMAKIATLDRNWRITDLTKRDGGHKYFPHSIEF